jgi:CRISPR type III-A-associated RAMP protein Csm4
MRAVRFPLKPMSHFHFGEIAQDEKSNIATTSSYPHSDTLFSSLVNCYAQICESDEVNCFIDDFKKSETKISSMFFVLTINEMSIYFLPKPLLYSTQPFGRDYYKQFKKIEFISTSVWETITDANDFFNIEKCSIINEKFVVLKGEIIDSLVGNVCIYSKVTQPKVPIRVANESDSIYFETDLEIGDNSNLSQQVEIGFYFLYESTQEKRLEEAIKQMSLSGIGGGRSTGTGVLGHPVFEDLSAFNFSNLNSDKYCCVSMAIPDNQSEFGMFDLYETQIRGGRKMESGKQMFVRMIKEGAVLSGNPKGKLAIIGTDDHGNTVLRNGVCFLLPLNTKKDDRILSL